MNENKKVLIVVGIVAVIIGLIAFGMFSTSLERQKIMNQFKDAYAASEGQFIYIGRPGCGACSTFSPVLKRVAEKFKINYIDINTDKLSESQLRVMCDDLGIDWEEFGTPTIAVVKDNQVVKKNVGALSEESLILFLTESNLISE